MPLNLWKGEWKDESKYTIRTTFNGIIKENPTFVLMLGMCPTLAVTTSAVNGIGMGLTTTAVLAASNLMISLLRKFIPDSVRMPAYIVVVASFVTIVQLCWRDFFRAFIPLLAFTSSYRGKLYYPGRAEAYASKNPPVPSLLTALAWVLDLP